jgi:hypothetical protein
MHEKDLISKTFPATSWIKQLFRRTIEGEELGSWTFLDLVLESRETEITVFIDKVKLGDCSAERVEQRQLRGTISAGEDQGDIEANMTL